MELKDQELNETVLEEPNAVEEVVDKKLRRIEEKKKARLRTRGPYRKALIEA